MQDHPQLHMELKECLGYKNLIIEEYGGGRKEGKEAGREGGKE